MEEFNEWDGINQMEMNELDMMELEEWNNLDEWNGIEEVDVDDDDWLYCDEEDEDDDDIIDDANVSRENTIKIYPGTLL